MKWETVDQLTGAARVVLKSGEIVAWLTPVGKPLQLEWQLLVAGKRTISYTTKEGAMKAYLLGETPSEEWEA